MFKCYDLVVNVMLCERRRSNDDVVSLMCSAVIKARIKDEFCCLILHGYELL